MKFQKLIVSAAIVCLLVGASGAAMAVNECLEGIITGVIEEDIIFENRSCIINDATVTGVIEVKNAENITIVGSEVSGRVLVEQSRYATVVGNQLERNLRVRNNEVALVAANIASAVIAVNRNVGASVKQNASVALICRGNTRLDSTFNQNEEENCR